MLTTQCGPPGADVVSASGQLSDSEFSELDERQVGTFLESFRPYLAAIAQAELPSGLGGKLGASDVVQDTIIKGFERYSQFEGTTREELARWLRAILRNHIANVIEAYSAQKRDIAREQPGYSGLADPWQSSPSAAALSREEQERLDAALAALAEEPRRVILLRHRENRTFAEIGAALGKSEEAVRKLWFRAVSKLQQHLIRPAG